MSEHLCTLSTGDKVYFYDKSIVIFFEGARKVLSTSLYNGGYHDDYVAVYNYDAKQGAGMPCEMLADTYVEHMRLVSKRLALDPDKVSGMGTAASMENAVVETLSFKELTVTAIVTGGIETNGGRAGDPADYYKPMPKPKYGTINIMLLLDCDMPEGVMARALVTCTEAKTAAIQELLEGSKYSNGIATGSGTDQTIIIANSASELYMEGAGKHSKLGELIGKTVKNAVKKALAKQSGLTPTKQHDVFRRLKRFDIKPGDMWQAYSAQDAAPCHSSCSDFVSVSERIMSSMAGTPRGAGTLGKGRPYPIVSQRRILTFIPVPAQRSLSSLIMGMTNPSKSARVASSR